MFSILLLFIWIHSSTAFILNLNDTDYARLPPIHHMDIYEECFDEPDSMYCVAEFALVSDEPTELMTIIKKISDSAIHFNHTLLRYGFCMKKTCNKFYNASGTDEDLKVSLEACTNETIYKKYKLKTKLGNYYDCSNRDREYPIENLDLAVAVVCIMIVLVNIVASLCDRYLEKGKNVGALRYLYCFSIFRNWKKFTALPGEGQDPRIKALGSIHGIRSLTIIPMLITHNSIIALILIVNPKFLEDWTQVKLASIFLNGTIIMQTFFVISSFLLVYNWLIATEKKKEAASLTMLPLQIIARWLRLTPSYGLILALTTTWFGRITYGPLWKKAVYYEVSDCRRDWWQHILYINNFFSSQCMPQAWYLACDTQLYIIGVIVFLTCKTAVTRKVVLSLLFLTGIITSVLITYYENLNGVLIASPKKGLEFIFEELVFIKVFVKPYTNITGYAIGMALGYIIYNWQKNGGNPKKFQKYKYIYWSMFLMGCLCNFSTFIFYAEGPEQPVYVHLIYAAFLRPVFGTIIGIVLAGLIIQFEGLYRTILNWRPFTYISRLSFSAYLLHIIFIRVRVASMVTLYRMTMTDMFLKNCTLLTGEFIASFFFYMLVESPFANLTGQLFKKPATPAIEDKKEDVNTTTKTEENGTNMTQLQVEDGTIVMKM